MARSRQRTVAASSGATPGSVLPVSGVPSPRSPTSGSVVPLRSQQEISANASRRTTVPPDPLVHLGHQVRLASQVATEHQARRETMPLICRRRPSLSAPLALLDHPDHLDPAVVLDRLVTKDLLELLVMADKRVPVVHPVMPAALATRVQLDRLVRKDDLANLDSLVNEDLLVPRDPKVDPVGGGQLAPLVQKANLVPPEVPDQEARAVARDHLDQLEGPDPKDRLASLATTLSIVLAHSSRVSR